jgi:hypothetical protein
MIKLYKDGRDYCIETNNVQDEKEFIEQFAAAFCGADATHDHQQAKMLLEGFLPHAVDTVCNFRGITKGTGNVREVRAIIAGNVPPGDPLHMHLTEADEEEATRPDPQATNNNGSA